MDPAITSSSGNDKERASAGATVGDAIYSMSPETEADSLRGPLVVGGRLSYMDDGQRRSRRILGGGAIMALNKAQVWLAWDTCWVRRVKDLCQKLP